MAQLLTRIRKKLHYVRGRIRHCAARCRERLYRFWHVRAGKTLAMFLFTGCLVGAIELVFSQINLVYVTDSEGASAVLLAQTDNAQELVRLSGLQVGKYDEYYYTAYSGNHAVLTVQRAYPVTVNVDGTSQTAYLNGGNVEDALQQLNIALGDEDYVEPSLHTTMSEGDTASVHRVTYTDTTVQTPIPFETVYRYTSLLYRYPGSSYVLQNGQDGVQETVYRERRVDGEVESSEQIDQYVTVQPVSQEVLAYNAGAPVSDISAPEGYSVVNNAPSSYRYMIAGAVCTGYSSSSGSGASRLGLYAGTVAVNPNEIPYGSLLYITSADGSFVYGWAIATDTGTALMEGSIDVDLYYDTYLESVLNGKKLMNVYVVS